MIGFIGSVFSPWYRWSGRREPRNHVCLNVATYGPQGRFTMTDRGRAALRQSPQALQIGPSRMAWAAGTLVIDVNEWGAPPRIGPVRGQIRLTPQAVTGVEVALTPDRGHIWRPFAPSARIEVDISPGHCWTGHGYFDANFGTAALEADFRTWTWGRYPVGDGAVTFYDGVRRDGSTLEQAIAFDGAGRASRIDPPPAARLPRTFWQLARTTRADPGFAPRQTLAMLDAPFYSRSMVTTRIGGVETTGVHEALDLTRYRQPWLKPMIALRVPRRPGWTFPD
ncbi:MAG: carotenoid 1,2-hydratase [Gemmobacter sp.]